MNRRTSHLSFKYYVGFVFLYFVFKACLDFLSFRVYLENNTLPHQIPSVNLASEVLLEYVLPFITVVLVSKTLLLLFDSADRSSELLSKKLRV
jgi:hypothetical protein